MVSSAGIRDTITTLSDLQQRLGILQTQNNAFFAEWMTHLPALNLQEQRGIDRIKQRYDYQRVDGLLLESTINLVVTSPLLELGGFANGFQGICWRGDRPVCIMSLHRGQVID
jgi:hypothetical protein